MGKKTGCGGSKRRKGKKHTEDYLEQRETIIKQDMMEYGYIEKTLGNGRFSIVCPDNKKRLGILRGNMRKKVWIVCGDMILYGIRDFQDDKVDILHKYTTEDVKNLYRWEEISTNFYEVYTSDIHDHNGNQKENKELDVEFLHDDEILNREIEKELGEEWTRVN